VKIFPPKKRDLGIDAEGESNTVQKSVAVFPSPAGMSLTKLSLALNNLPSPSSRKFDQNKSRNLVHFLQCMKGSQTNIIAGE